MIHIKFKYLHRLSTDISTVVTIVKKKELIFSFESSSNVLYEKLSHTFNLTKHSNQTLCIAKYFIAPDSKIKSNFKLFFLALSCIIEC